MPTPLFYQEINQLNSKSRINPRASYKEALKYAGINLNLSDANENAIAFSDKKQNLGTVTFGMGY